LPAQKDLLNGIFATDAGIENDPIDARDGAGAAIGAVAGGGKGAAIGGLSGGIAGLVYDLATRNK
jgi:hypothetical protein